MGLLLPFRLGLASVLLVVQLLFAVWFLWVAYDIRMYPIKDFGMIIHEFDPWFNYRAAEYLAENGLEKFFKWYDYMSWYPLGRPIGTTIYPGMQITAYGIREAMLRVPAFTTEVPNHIVLTWLKELISWMRSQGFTSVPPVPDTISYEPMSVNDICCMIPPWFGSIASLFTGLLTYEVSRSMNAAVVAIGVMAVIPAHLMRSVGGEFDNEAVAMAAISCTFWLWLRSVRTPRSWPWGLLTGVSYFYMVLTWGGYIFVINMIGVHALIMAASGRFNSGVHKAYTLFFVIGTYGAIQIPVVGWQPLRSLEQMGPLLVFLGYQVMAFCDMMRRRLNMTTMKFVSFRITAFIFLILALIVVTLILYPTGYFGPLSARIRGLFVRHTKTGNPLVDSVAEHRPASAGIYMNYLNLPLDFCFFGALVCVYKRTNGCYFAAIYAAVAIHFSGKMSRLVLICAPICTIGCAVFFGFVIDFMIEPVLLILGKQPYEPPKGAIGGNADSQESALNGKSSILEAGDELEALQTNSFEGHFEPGDRGRVSGFYEKDGNRRVKVMWYKTGKMSIYPPASWRKGFKMISKARWPSVGHELQVLPDKRFESNGVLCFEPGDKGVVSSLFDDNGVKIIRIHWSRLGRDSDMTLNKWMEWFRFVDVEAAVKCKAKAKAKAQAQAKVELPPLAEHEEEHRPGGAMEVKAQRKEEFWESFDAETMQTYIDTRVFLDRSPKALLGRLGFSAVLVLVLLAFKPTVHTFVDHCHAVAVSLSNPRVVFWAKDKNGDRILMDDYLKGYQWIDENTPKDARIMAWWDYGYQITGIAKRTSIADGNTWNHEHIATLGKTLTSPERKAWSVIRHLADYVLVWAGGGGDDLAKSPHLARIGNSVYPDHCGDDDPRCTKFGLNADRTPTPMMAKSLLYKMVMHNMKDGIKVNSELFELVHKTHYGKVMIYKVMNVSQESKDWVADPKNRVCDAPGSWYCVGQYPPALEKLIEKRRSFAQVEDFNSKGEKSAYTKLIEKEKAGKKEL